MRPCHNGWGYLEIWLTIDGKQIRKLVHRLVAKEFIPNPLDKPEVNHIDGNKQNNRVDNLEWVTGSENKRHAFLTGLNDRKSYNAGKPKKKVIAVETGQTYESINECAKQLGRSRAAVLHCLEGKTKTCKNLHITYI